MPVPKLCRMYPQSLLQLSFNPAWEYCRINMIGFIKISIYNKISVSLQSVIRNECFLNQNLYIAWPGPFHDVLSNYFYFSVSVVV